MELNLDCNCSSWSLVWILTVSRCDLVSFQWFRSSGWLLVMAAFIWFCFYTTSYEYDRGWLCVNATIPIWRYLIIFIICSTIPLSLGFILFEVEFEVAIIIFYTVGHWSWYQHHNQNSVVSRFYSACSD